MQLNWKYRFWTGPASAPNMRFGSALARLLLRAFRWYQTNGPRNDLAGQTGQGARTNYMTAETLVGLLEEMMDLKLQAYAQANLKLTPEVAQILNAKRETDRRRLAQIRTDLLRFLES